MSAVVVAVPIAPAAAAFPASAAIPMAPATAALPASAAVLTAPAMAAFPASAAAPMAPAAAAFPASAAVPTGALILLLLLDNFKSRFQSIHLLCDHHLEIVHLLF